MQYNIVSEISDNTVRPVITALEQAKVGEPILIHLPYNSGGSVHAALDLINAIATSQADIVIEVDRYVISAAAFIYCWFLVYKEDHVQVTTTGANTLMIYHRPRLVVADRYLGFIDDIDPEAGDDWEELKFLTDLFDNVFDEILNALEQNVVMDDTILYNEKYQFKRDLLHAKEGYYANQDFVLPI